MATIDLLRADSTGARCYAVAVADLRTMLSHRRWLTLWLVAMALAVRVLVPGGYMPAASGSLALTICPGHMASDAAAMPMPGMAHDHHGGHGSDHGHDRSDQACPFAGLAMPMAAGAEHSPIPASSSLSVALPVGALADARAPPRLAHLQPPLRGPPSLG